MICKINLIWANLKVPQVQIPPKSQIIQKNKHQGEALNDA